MLFIGFFCFESIYSKVEQKFVKFSTAGFIIDSDPRGLNVRNMPGGKIKDRLPGGTTLGITGAQGNGYKLKAQNN